MVIFIDTSSLLKRYVEEQGSTEVDRYFESGINIWISPVTIIEVNSALKRKMKEGTIDNEAYHIAINFWEQDSNQYSIVAYSEQLISKALELIKSHDLKTLDSIQIASAILSGADKCITSDFKMHQVMQFFLKENAVFI